ncbi:MAG: hypothetical protein II670_10065 [Alphaproteobacteria bacterium]|nr:hypothetical protein [Alphaproteobacteria bacterium]
MGTWIKNPYYWASIVKVIGKAVGDCVAGQNEFADRKCGDVITFANTNFESYMPENWNAVVIYNCVFTIISIATDENWDKIFKNDNTYVFEGCYYSMARSRELFEAQCKKIRAHYNSHYYSKIAQSKDVIAKQTKLKRDLDKAIKDIKAYADALNMDGLLRSEMQKVNNRYKEGKSLNDVVPDLLECFSKNEPCVQFCSVSGDNYCKSNYIVTQNNKEIYAYLPKFQYDKGTWSIMSIAINTGSISDNLNKYTVNSIYELNNLNDIKTHCQYVFEILDGLVSN